MATTRATRARPDASDGEDVLELERAVKRMHTGRGDGAATATATTRAGAYAEVNAMLRALHFERARRLGADAADGDGGTTRGGTGDRGARGGE